LKLQFIVDKGENVDSLLVFLALVELVLHFLVGLILVDGLEPYPVFLEVVLVEELHQIVVLVVVDYHEAVPKAVEEDVLGLDFAFGEFVKGFFIVIHLNSFEEYVLMRLAHADHAQVIFALKV
jgi:hypothetical protein